MLKSGIGDGSLWRFEREGQRLTKICFPKSLQESRPPLLFIHGIEFSSPEECVSDFVYPMLEALGNKRILDRSIYIFTWNSLLTNNLKISDILKCSLIKKLQYIVTEIPKCRTYLADVERRAREAAKFLLPFIVDWNSELKTGPTVITHSMGGVVWAEALKMLFLESANLARPGVWWSLQPALPHDAFTPNGDYKMISEIYSGRDFAKALVWYSRKDFVLSTLYLLSKRNFALGHTGCFEGIIPQRDITYLAGEAHGMQHLSKRLGHFFTRVSSMICEDADALKI